MKKHLVIAPVLVFSLLALTVSARAAAFEDLSRDPSGSEPARVSAPAPIAVSAAALDVSIRPDGEIRVLTTRPVPQGLRILPDDDIREDLPGKAEVLPVPVYKAGAEKMAYTGAIDPLNLIPADLKAAALDYYQANKDKIGNLRYIAVIDFAKHSSVARFYIADTAEATVRVIQVAHGSGSDPDNDGYPTIFSNKQDSLSSSLGFYLTGEIYYGKHGRSMRLHGLSATNSNAFARAVVIHSADYVSDENVQPGRSWGCPAVSTSNIASVIAELKGGALIYAGLSGAK